MGVHYLLVAGFTAGLGSEWVADMNRKHRLVQRLELAGFLLRNPILRGREIEIPLRVMDPLALRSQSSQSISSCLLGLLGESERIACAANVLLLDEFDLLLRGCDVLFFLLFGG